MLHYLKFQIPTAYVLNFVKKYCSYQADNEATYKKWLEIKTQERKEKRKAEKQSKANLNSSSVYQNDLNQDERDGKS